VCRLPRSCGGSCTHGRWHPPRLSTRDDTDNSTTTPNARRQRPSVTSQHKCGVSQSPQARMFVERLSHHSVSCNLERPTMRCVASWHPLTARAARAGGGVASEAQGLQCKVLDSTQDNNHHTTCPSPPATHCAGLSARHVSRSLAALVWHCY
jgi:hypothetical protein